MSQGSLLVIGAGAGGLAAARTASGSARTTLVTAGPLGGDCTWTGCVPSKALLECARAGLDYAGARARLLDSRARIAAEEDEAALTREGIDVILGHATFTGPSTVTITPADGPTRALQVDRTVIATGAAPVVPAIPGLRESPYLTNDSVFDLEALPPSLTVLGAGAIGCELAFAFARLGSTVTIVEAADRILGKEEPEASVVVQAALEGAGVRVLVGTRATSVSHSAGEFTVGTEAAGEVRSSQLLVAIGRRPVTDGLGLDAAGVTTDDKGYVTVDSSLRTSAPGIWAVGDVTGLLPFTHAADAMGRKAARNALGARFGTSYSHRATPWVTFTDPEVARVGLTEAEAADQVPGARVAFLPLADLDRAILADRTEGFVKLVAGPRRLSRNLGGGRLLGATIVAPRAGEMIAEVALAMHLDVLAARLAQATHAYPTWGSAVQIAAAQLVGEFAGRSARAARRG